MLKTAIKGAALGAWVFVAGYGVAAWIGSGIKRGVEEAWVAGSRAGAPDLHIVSEKQVG